LKIRLQNCFEGVISRGIPFKAYKCALFELLDFFASFVNAFKMINIFTTIWCKQVAALPIDFLSTLQNCIGLCGGVPGALLGLSGSAATCNRKRGQLNF
jgi:hypothetical protein